MIKISPSTLAMEEDKIVDSLKSLQDLNVDYIHCDILRDDFVSNNILGDKTLTDIRNHTVLPMDVHIMSKSVFPLLEKILPLKCNIVSVHYEAFDNDKDIIRALKKIRASHSYAGLAIKPMTPANKIFHLLNYVDVVLVMGVEPGKSGQKMISNTCPKVKELRSYMYENKINAQIEVDGGVTMENLKMLADVGVDTVVMGKTFASTPDNKKADLIKKIHKM